MSKRKLDTRLPVRSWIFSAVLIAVVGSLGLLSESYGNYINEHELARINVYGHRIMSHDRLTDMLEKYYGQRLNEVDLSEIRDRFIEYPLVRSAKVTRNYPDELDIYIRELVPIAYIQMGRVLTVDTQGTLLPLPDNGMLYNLPIITQLDGEFAAAKIGERLESDRVAMLVKYLGEIREHHPGIYLDISEVSFKPEQGIKLISAVNSTPVLMGEWENAREAVHILSAFLQGDKNDQVIDAYEYIDLRFANQIIVKERELR